jgi:outer membrane protein TolC
MYFIREGSETPLPPTDPLPRLRGLQKDYVKSLDRIVHLTETGLEKGIVSPLDAVGAASELASAQLELAESADQKQKVLEELTKRLKRYEALVQARVAAGNLSTFDAARVEAARLKAEIELEKWKAAK